MGSVTVEDLAQLNPEESLSSLEAQLDQLSFDQYPLSVQDLVISKELLSLGHTIPQAYNAEDIDRLSSSELSELAQDLGLYYEIDTADQELQTRVRRILRFLHLLKDRPLPPSNLSTVQSTTHNPFIVPDLDAIVGPKVRYLSQGTTAEVYESEFGYAVKDIFSSSIDESSLNEIRILRYVDHPNIINPVALQLYPLKLALPLAQSDLNQVDLRTIDVRKLIFYQIFRALNYLHSRRVWHLDIKPANILIFNVHGSTIVKLTDFGLSTLNLHNTKLSYETVTLYWRAPEIFNSQPYDESVDIWATGMMLLNVSDPSLFGDGNYPQTKFQTRIFELLGTPSAEQWPEYKDSFLDQNIGQTFSGTIRWTDYDTQEVEVLQSCLTWPGLRKSADDILQLPYFDQYRDDIENQLPVNPPEETSCFQHLLDHQISIRGNNRYYSDESRKVLINWSWEVSKNLELSTATVFSAVMLMDVINDRGKIPMKSLQKYMVSCLFIASQYEDYYPATQEWLSHIFSDLFSSEELDSAIARALTRLHFELVIPTVWTFITEWGLQTGTSDNYIRTVKIVQHGNELKTVAQKLILNYNYVKTYTPSQLAQICFEALNLNVSCLSSEQLYHSGIAQYVAQS